MKRLNSRGFTLVEILVTAVILGVVAMAAAEGLRVIFRYTAQTKDARNRDRIVVSLLQNVTENISNMQKSYDPDPQIKANLLNPDKLPLAWDQGQVVEAASCPNCAGRVGFFIEALSSTRGISRLTVRITHKSLIKGYQDYVFIVSDD